MAKMTEMYVYMHKNLINNKIYVGQTNNPFLRWEYNGIHYKDSKYFYNAIQKYGWNNFEHNILKDNLTEEEANYCEEYYIKYFNTMDRKFGYNLKSGGLRNNHCKEIKNKIRESNKISWAKKKIEEPEYFINFKKEQSEKVSKKVICLNTG